MDEILDAETLRHNLRMFTGTERWYRHNIARRMLYTDGVQYFAEKAGAYWLLDIIATEIVPKQNVKRDNYFLSITVTVDSESKAVIKATTEDEEGKEVVAHTRNVPFTTLFEGEWKFYSIVQDEENVVVLLPSEY